MVFILVLLVIDKYLSISTCGILGEQSNRITLHIPEEPHRGKLLNEFLNVLV